MLSNFNFSTGCFESYSLEGVIYYGKVLIVEFSDNEEQIFQQTVEWLFSKLSSTPALIKQQATDFHIDPYTRTFVNEKGHSSSRILWKDSI